MPSRPESRVNVIEDVLERYPSSAPLLVTLSSDGERRIWHAGELIAMSAGLSGAFAARGVRRGDVVMTLIGNRIEWVLSLLACWRMGAVALPCSTQLRRADLARRLAVASPALCVGAPEQLALLDGAVAVMDLDEVGVVLDEDRPQEPPADVCALDPSDPALIVFTSGTTGEPRAALHPQRYLLAQDTQAEHWLGARRGDLVWCTTATGWSKSARNVFLAPWLRGAAALLHESRFDPAERLEICEREAVSVLCQAPTEYRILAARAELRPLSSLRRAVSAGEPIDRDSIDVWRRATGIGIHDGYGQTETGQVTGNLVGEPARDGSMGRPLPGFEVRVEEGELQVRVERCPTFFSRYLDAEPFAGEWWPTGDLVRSDGDGYLWHEGRRDDMIISSGYRIGPQEVEEALCSHPAVADAAAVPAPDAERGAVVRAVVVVRGREPSPALAGELRDHVMRVTAPYKAPRILDFAESLPRTQSGKLRRAELRDDG